MDDIDDATLARIRDLTIEVARQERRCNRWLGVDNTKLLRAMRRKAEAQAERHRLLRGQAAGDRLAAEAARSRVRLAAALRRI